MGRKRDPKIQKLRERALELKEAGLSPAEISQEEEFVAFGADAETVRRWLRVVRGRQPKTRDRYRRLKEEGLSRAEITQKLKISEAHSWRLDREVGGPKYVSAKMRLPTFFAEPDKHRFADWAMRESFGWELNHRLVELIDDKPADSATIDCTRRAIAHLEALLEIRRGEPAQWTRCQLVQARANEAARLRAADEPGEAALALEHSRRVSVGCPECRADLDRRQAAILKDLARLEPRPDHARVLFYDALELVHRSRAYYTASGGFGHDVHKDGVGNCDLGEAAVLFYAGQARRAMEVTQRGIERAKPGGTPHKLLLIALCYFADQLGATADAHKVVDKELAESRSTGQHMIRMWCLKARLLESDGDKAGAIEQLEEALSHVEPYVQLRSAAAYVLGQIERISGTGGFGLDLRIEDLGDAEVEGANNGVDAPLKFSAPWLGEAFELFDRARRLSWLGGVKKARGANSEARAAFKGALDLLRAQARGFMPT